MHMRHMRLSDKPWTGLGKHLQSHDLRHSGRRSPSERVWLTTVWPEDPHGGCGAGRPLKNKVYVMLSWILNKTAAALVRSGFVTFHSFLFTVLPIDSMAGQNNSNQV